LSSKANALTRVTIRQIAQDAEVSVPTVSQILNGHGDRFREETRKRVLESASRLQFQPSRAARVLRGTATKTIGLIAHGISGYSGLNQADMVAMFDRTLREHGYRSLLGFCWSDHNQMRDHLNEMIAHQVEGIVLLSPWVYAADTPLSSLIPQDMPTLCAYSKADAPIDLKCDEVRISYPNGMAALAEHCLQQGHRSFAFACSKLSTNYDKFEGIRNTLAKHGITFDTDHVFEGADGLEHESSLAPRIMSLNPKPTCIFCSNDYVAISMMRGVAQLGYRVPQDVSVTGFDDLWIARIAEVPLTTLRIPREQIGVMAAQMILERIKSDTQPPRLKEFDLELVKRASVGPKLD